MLSLHIPHLLESAHYSLCVALHLSLHITHLLESAHYSPLHSHPHTHTYAHTHIHNGRTRKVNNLRRGEVQPRSALAQVHSLSALPGSSHATGAGVSATQSHATASPPPLPSGCAVSGRGGVHSHYPPVTPVGGASQRSPPTVCAPHGGGSLRRQCADGEVARCFCLSLSSVCPHIHKHTHTHPHTFLYTYAQTLSFSFTIHTHAHTTHTHTHTHILAHTRAHTHAYMHVRTHARTHAHVHAHTHASTHTHVNMHTCAHTHTCLNTNINTNTRAGVEPRHEVSVR